jgi:predicted nucleic acid-binding protein
MRRRRGSASSAPAIAFIDSSGLYAVLDRGDTSHQRAVDQFHALSTAGTRLVLTNFIRAEAHALILNRLGHAVADRFLTDLSRMPPGSFIRVSQADEQAALDLIARYRDKDFSLTDATSFVVTERLGITHAFSFDDDFRQYGWTVLPLV